MAGEKELYESVAKFLQEALGCASTAINTGPRYAQIDVLGLCGRRSNFGSQTEVIAVEVKRGGTRFLHYVGQAVSYSLYCHRVYLAWEKPDGNCFTQEEIDIASKFGIGLLSISTECEIRLAATSTEFRPEHHRVLEAIDRLKYFQCTICHAHYPKERSVWINQPGAINTSVDPSYRGRFHKAVQKRSPAVYWLYHLAEIHEDKRMYTKDNRFICKDCCSIFSAFLP